MFESQQLAIGAVAQKDANSKGEKNRDSMNLMKKVLERVMAREKSVITEWCSRNSTQMQTALNAVTHLHEQAENMQKDLQDSHASLAVRSHVCLTWMCLASVPDAFLTTGALTTCRGLAPSQPLGLDSRAIRAYRTRISIVVPPLHSKWLLSHCSLPTTLNMLVQRKLIAVHDRPASRHTHYLVYRIHPPTTPA